MTVDKNDFFRQMTIRICGSLDIQTALTRCMAYMEGIIPVEAMQLGLYESDTNVIRSYAVVAPSNLQIPKTYSPFTLKQRGDMVRRLKAYKRVEIINRPASYPEMSRVLRHVGHSLNMSIMVMRLELEGNFIGNLFLTTTGIDQYQSSHARLIDMLHDPFAIAMANSLKHRELLRLKDMLTENNRYLRGELRALSGEDIVGKEFGLKRVMEMVEQVAAMDSPVLLLGDTGVGKEVIASAIHRFSHHAEGPFVKVNCGAIPETLIDSELFGYEKGAFTGAVDRKRGRFERADQGTIFLDEIGELPLPAQVRLLHVVQHREIERVGGTRFLPVNVRIVSATHRNLANMVAQKKFREDLWYRLNVFPITIPPLRQRREDIPMLTHYFLEQKTRQLRIDRIPQLASSAMDRLVAHHWPGNVRELQNVIERALIQYRGGLLRFDNLSAESKTDGMPGMLGNPHGAPVMPLNELNTRHIQEVLGRTRGRINGPKGAAELLDIHPNTLRKRMAKLGIPFGRKSEKFGIKGQDP